MKYRYNAEIQINVDFDLSQTIYKLNEVANVLESLFRGFIFENDNGERFDEAPAFVAILDGIELILMGPPDDVYEVYDEIENANFFCFSMKTKSPIDLETYKQYNSKVLNFLLNEELKSDNGIFIDVTFDLINFINNNSNLKCEQLT
ncbi:hypothetical protein NFHSH190041_13280 [Shewanella sp. NFH-SH190041]|uniref:hypothetical protein n=1 Tax=Shewanella sp. NFH-SH190041 TaxID=2950245 RepID=UPI0021C47EBF|nr:hypothetical protein [Shewanella sp. NFH-SH190041]BDM63876.1 hypothetical protein NFHSH190041_13280 [Shewanella sp. NFH-SH190041]